MLTDKECDELRDTVFAQLPDLHAVMQHAAIDRALIRAGYAAALAAREQEPVACLDHAMKRCGCYTMLTAPARSQDERKGEA